jgi:preprotein translocase subunit Sec63
MSLFARSIERTLVRGIGLPTHHELASKEPLVVLGFYDACSLDDVKRRYRELARVMHPDKAGGEKATSDAFAIVSSAYEAVAAALEPR